MKLSKFLSMIVFITGFSLLYVYQQTEVFRLGYCAQKRQVFAQDLLDKNTILRYNIDRNSSLVMIGSSISNQSDFQMPDSYRLVRLAPSAGGLKLKSSVKKETFASRVFGLKRQAEAGVLNP